jgi:hypothetical protein
MRDTVDAAAPASEASAAAEPALPEVDQTVTEVRCGNCGTKASWRGELTDEMIARTFTRGLEPITKLPICVHCGTPMLHVRLFTAEEALAKAAQELDTERAGDAAKPMYQPSIPGIRPAFDWKRAQLTAESLERNTAKAEADWEEAKEEASSRKKAFDAAVETLRQHIRDMRTPRIEAEYEARKNGTSDATPAAAAADSVPAPCAFELKTGQVCPICRTVSAPRTGEQTTTAHLAKAAFDCAVEQALTPSNLATVIMLVTGIEVPLADVERWSPADAMNVTQYVDQFAAALLKGDATNAVPRPEALGRQHVVYDMEGLKSCSVCGAMLAYLATALGHELAEGQLVGVDCPGDPAAEGPEPARQPKPRHATKEARQRVKQAAANEPSTARGEKRMAKVESPKRGKKGGRR